MYFDKVYGDGPVNGLFLTHTETSPILGLYETSFDRYSHRKLSPGEYNDPQPVLWLISVVIRPNISGTICAAVTLQQAPPETYLSGIAYCNAMGNINGYHLHLSWYNHHSMYGTESGGSCRGSWIATCVHTLPCIYDGSVVPERG